tara:strand:- start:4762 stop:5184 length:423 start_codon:yes stop_codon:yes gene_type:complete
MNETKIKIGQGYSIELNLNELNIIDFININGDKNPIHTDDEFCQRYSIFKEKVIPGALVVSFFSSIFGNNLPGKGSVLLKQEVNYKNPIFYGEKIILNVKILQIIESKHIYKLETLCFNNDDKLVIDGISYIYNKIVNIV